jgi:hypothetical protein
MKNNVFWVFETPKARLDNNYVLILFLKKRRRRRRSVWI